MSIPLEIDVEILEYDPKAYREVWRDLPKRKYKARRANGDTLTVWGAWDAASGSIIMRCDQYDGSALSVDMKRVMSRYAALLDHALTHLEQTPSPEPTD